MKVAVKTALAAKYQVSIQILYLHADLKKLNAHPMKNKSPFFTIILAISTIQSAFAQGFEGYYRFPAIHKETIIFTAEGDLWSVPIAGGLAQRLTTHPAEETHPNISPDGQTIAFTGNYEGSAEVYTIPLKGGLPVRRTFQAETSRAAAWTPAGELVYSTSHFSTLPDLQLVKYNLGQQKHQRLPLSQASEASFNASGKTVYFVRPGYHRNVTKRYQGGTARQIWSFTEGDAEARKLTTDHPGESHHPQWWNNRIYFITDRDGTMNIWSMDETGKDLRQHTRHEGFDVRYMKANEGKIVYQIGADIRLYDIVAENDRKVEIRLQSDLDQLREKWVKDPAKYITSVHIHPNGKQVVITSRGRVFVAPVKSGRMVQISQKEGVRYRDATFSADGENILVLSDESGEFELVKIPANGIGAHQDMTNNGKILRFGAVPSPDGKWVAFSDLNEDLWLLNLETGQQKKLSTNDNGIGDVTWSGDSRWLSFVQWADNSFAQIFLYQMEGGTLTALTTDRANSQAPSWSPDGKWLYFLSDRNFQSLVGAPWGSRQPEPYFDKKYKLYHVSLKKGLRSPFRPMDELSVADQKEEKSKDEAVVVSIDLDNIQRRIQEVPVPPGNYANLHVNDQTLFWQDRTTGLNRKSSLMALKISSDAPKPKRVVEDIRAFDLSADGKKVLLRKGSNILVMDAGTSAPNNLRDAQIDLSKWRFSMDVQEDWRQIFTDAWRMERDYFYDPNMHGVDWKGMYNKYLPLVDRVTTRVELSDLIGRFVGELSALHTSVRGGDVRTGDDQVRVASLGARLSRDEAAGGYRIDHIYESDPDYPDQRSPLDHPELVVSNGDVIVHINGAQTLSVSDVGELLRNQAGQQTRIGIKYQDSGRQADLMVVPINSAYNLRYNDWEFSRRQEVEAKGAGKIGYVHLRAMGSRDLSQWYRDFYPVFDRQGLIVDVRHNRGGNIESFILEKLMRKAWMYWKSRNQKPYWNMQYAFRGHIVVLCDENTASDGEAFADGFRRLGLGKVIGTRTWGGEIWLSSSNRLTDGGLARAPMNGVYGPEGKWLIEGHGFVPDVEVVNLPHATFNGQDAQLEAAIDYLLEEIEKDPREVPAPPPFPNKSWKP